MAVSSSSWSQIEVTGLVQGTHVQVGSESVASAGSRLLDLEGLAVREVARDVFGGRVVHVVTADPAASACPSCGGVLDLGEGPGHDQAARYSVRAAPGAPGLAQAAVAVNDPRAQR